MMRRRVEWLAEHARREATWLIAIINTASVNSSVGLVAWLGDTPTACCAGEATPAQGTATAMQSTTIVFGFPFPLLIDYPDMEGTETCLCCVTLSSYAISISVSWKLRLLFPFPFEREWSKHVN
jgi:hypothetical protein